MFLKAIYVRMVVFMALICSALGLGLESLSVFFQQNLVLNSIIASVTLLGVGVLFRQFVRLLPPIRWLVYVQNPSNKKAPNPGMLKPIKEMLIQQKNVLSGAQSQMILSQLDAQLAEQREIGKYLIGVCVFLGLLGTFWGLSQTLQSVSGVVMGMPTESTNSLGFLTQLKEGLSSPLSGMGVAFSSSLLGLLGSLILGFLEFQLHQARSRFFSHVEHWMHTHALKGLHQLTTTHVPSESLIQALLGQTMESLDQINHTLHAFQDHNRLLTQSMTHLSDQVSRLVDQRFTEHNVLLKVAESLVSLQSTTQDFQHSIASNKFGVDESTAHHIRNLDHATYRLVDAITQGQASLARELRNEIRLLSRTLSSIAEGEPLPSIETPTPSKDTRRKSA